MSADTQDTPKHATPGPWRTEASTRTRLEHTHPRDAPPASPCAPRPLVFRLICDTLKNMLPSFGTLTLFIQPSPTMTGERLVRARERRHAHLHARSQTPDLPMLRALRRELCSPQYRLRPKASYCWFPPRFPPRLLRERYPPPKIPALALLGAPNSLLRDADGIPPIPPNTPPRPPPPPLPSIGK